MGTLAYVKYKAWNKKKHDDYEIWNWHLPQNNPKIKEKTMKEAKRDLACKDPSLKWVPIHEPNERKGWAYV